MKLNENEKKKIIYENIYIQDSKSGMKKNIDQRETQTELELDQN